MIDRTVECEKPSLEGFLRGVLTAAELSRPLIVSFSQWQRPLAVTAEAALELHGMGSDVHVAAWSGVTPLRDTGWFVNHAVSRLLLRRTPDQIMAKALRRAGLPARAFVRPPIRHWRPEDTLPSLDRPTRGAIRSLQYRGTPMGKALLQVNPDTETAVAEDYVWPTGWVQTAIRSYAYVFDQVTRLIQQNGISTVIVYNGRFLHDRAAAAAAEAADIPVLYFDGGGADTDYDLTREPTHDWIAFQHRILQMYADWNPSTRDEIAREWYDRRIAHEDPANALFVASQERGVLAELPKGRRHIVYFSSSGDEIIELDFDWSLYFTNQEIALRVLVEECARRPDVDLTVRTHPHMRLKPADDLVQWEAAVAATPPDLHIDAKSPVDSYELMKAADIVVTYGSTVGVESAYLGKPTIVMGPSAYGILGCAEEVHSPEELADALDGAKAADAERAVCYGLMMMRRGMVFRHVQGDEVDGFVIQDVNIRPSGDLPARVSDLLQKRRNRRLLERRR